MFALVSLTAALAASLLVVGPVGAVPHILTMLRTRSAAGQSAAGWLVGIYANAAAGYVSVVQYDAVLLAVGNLLGGSLCALSVAVILTLRGRARRVGPAPRTHRAHSRQATGSSAALGAGQRAAAPAEARADAAVRELVFACGARVPTSERLHVRPVGVSPHAIGREAPLASCPELHRLGAALQGAGAPRESMLVLVSPRA